MNFLFIIGILFSSSDRNLPFIFGGRISTGYQDYRFENQRGDFYILLEPYLKYERIRKLGISISGNGIFYRYFITGNMRFIGDSNVNFQYSLKDISFRMVDSLTTLSKDITKPYELLSEIVLRNSLYSEIKVINRLTRKLSFNGFLRGGYNLFLYEDIDYSFIILNGEIEGYITKKVRGGGCIETKYFGIGDWMRFSPSLFIRSFLFRLKTEIRVGYNFLRKGKGEGLMGRIFVQYTMDKNEISGSIYRTAGEDFKANRYVTEGGGISFIWRASRKIRFGGDGNIFRVKFEEGKSTGYISTGFNAGWTLKSFEIFSSYRFFHPFEGMNFSDVRIGLGWEWK